MADGHLNKCKKCTKSDVSMRYKDPYGRSKIREYEKLRFGTVKRKLQIQKIQELRRIKDPQKYIARNLVGNALRDGKITRGTCLFCGDPETQAHHENYFKPLDIIWVCFKHHREMFHQQKVGV